MRFESQWIVGCIDLLTSRPSTSTSKSSKTSFNEVAKRPSERQSHEVDLFYLNGFESYYKFTQEKWLTHAVSGVASNIILSGPTIAAFKPSTWFFIKDTRGATTMQTDDIHACLSAFSTPTAIPSNTNGAISKQSDLIPLENEKICPSHWHMTRQLFSDFLITHCILISVDQNLKHLQHLPYSHGDQ